MSKPDERGAETENERFARRAKALFEESVDELDGATRSRLNQGRQAALAELAAGAATFGRWTQWVPATGVAAAAVVAVVLWNGNAPVESLAPATASDFELLLNEDSFDMLQDLEFYSWLDIDAELQLPPATEANVG